MNCFCVYRIKLLPSSYKSPADQVVCVHPHNRPKKVDLWLRRGRSASHIIRPFLWRSCADFMPHSDGGLSSRKHLEDWFFFLPRISAGNCSLFDDDICHAAACGDAFDLFRLRHHIGGRWEPQRERRRLGAKLLRVHRETAKDFPKTGGELGCGYEAEERGERQREGQNPERQHRIHGSEDSHTHRAGGQKALQDWNSPPGIQLHFPSGQRTSSWRRQRWRTALPRRGPCARRERRKAAADHLHLLSEQPEERGEYLYY